MQPTRRRKKRPNYGIRTVEVCRSKNGFGFTISGQQPCILSCIVPNSPAEQAGLRPGDYLVAVCGQNVSKVPHDDVVQLIGNCHGVLKLQIAENYYSDSSEEDFVMTIRQKPKHVFKNKSTVPNTHSLLLSKSQKLGSSVFDSYSFEDEFEATKSVENSVFSRENESVAIPQRNFNGISSSSVTQESNSMLQCIVGYLGTIEMPKKLTPVSRLQIVRGCIKRLRAEKRNHTPVLMTVFPCSLRLKNESGTTIAVYPGGRVTFCSSSNEQNKRYFGIVTTSLSDEPSNSCHVFVMLAPAHAEHAKLADKFSVECGDMAAVVGSPVSGSGSIGGDNGDAGCCACAHFPVNCDPIVAAVQKYYELQQQRNGGPGGSLDLDEPLVANSPQPSHDSSVTTSNSDSGIGFRDDSGHQSDRILVVDIQNQRLHIQAAGLPDPQYVDCYAEKSDRSNTSTNPPVLPTGVQNDQIHHSSYASNDSADNIFHWTTKQVYKSSCLNTGKWPNKNFEEITPTTRKISQGSLERRLSPKVFSNITEMYPISQSMEDIKMQSELYEDLEPPDNFMKKHSLQDLTVLTADIDAQSQSSKLVESERKVTAWAMSLERLLSDTVGLHAFAEFLKKEFSVENAYFWVACEKYRNCANFEERHKMAQYIHDRFLSNNASEPVNVDSSGKNLTLQQLQEADLNLLQNAQKQIFNLMKFDSYPRFLKSDVYKNYLLREISGENVTVSSDAVDADLLLIPPSAQKTESMKENVEESDRNQRTNRRRRSLLPWTRSRGKSRDRTTASNENVSSCSGSRTSLASWDLALPVSLCRVILPDGSSAMINIQPHQNVYYMISKLLEKRAMPYTSFQVISTATDKAVDLDESASTIAGKEVKIEWRIEFRLDLPDRKSLTVKSKPTHTLGAVLGPILSKHGYSLQMVTLCLMSENEVLEPNTLVSFIDKQRIQVLTRSTPIPNLQGWNYHGCGGAKPQQPVNLEEITNNLFQKVLYDKAENYRNPNNENITATQSEDWSSDHSSRILGKFLRKDSFHHDKHRRIKKYGEESSSDKKNTSTRIPMVIAKWKPSSKLDLRFEKDGLFEGLKRCQRGRLEDQRGTEINVELPEFLKDKENTPNGRKKMKKIRKDAVGETKTLDLETKDVTAATASVAAAYGSQQHTIVDKNAQECGSSCSKTTTMTTTSSSDHYQIPDFGNVADYQRGEGAGANDHDGEGDANIYANDVLNFGCNSNATPSVFKEPPPLPPKPKNIAWRLSNGVNYNFDTHSKSIYLDHPTSSFV